MRNTTLLFCAALAIPFATSAAQRGRGGGGGGGASGASSGGFTQRPATVGQIEDLGPARMLVDKRKKLGLADSTVNQLKALDKTITERNKPLMAQYDSIRREMRFPNRAPAPGEMASKMGAGAKSGGGGFGGGGGSDQSPEESAKLRAQMQALAAIAAQIRERRPADLAAALALLSTDQAEKAGEFVTEQNEEFDRLLPARR